MIVLLGKTASGKDTILNELVKKNNYKKLITYTTRPMRKGEIQDKTYHFISDEEFLKKKENGDFLECNEFDTVEGVWRYGSAKEDYLNADENTIIILTPSGFNALKLWIARNDINLDVISIFIYANDETIRYRLKKRGDKKEEAERRIKADRKDFKGLTDIVGRIIYNNLRDDLSSIVNRVNDYITKRKIIANEMGGNS